MTFRSVVYKDGESVMLLWPHEGQATAIEEDGYFDGLADEEMVVVNVDVDEDGSVRVQPVEHIRCWKPPPNVHPAQAREWPIAASDFVSFCFSDESRVDYFMEMISSDRV
jgi:hypothetical protein